MLHIHFLLVASVLAAPPPFFSPHCCGDPNSPNCRLCLVFFSGLFGASLSCSCATFVVARRLLLRCVLNQHISRFWRVTDSAAYGLYTCSFHWSLRSQFYFRIPPPHFFLFSLIVSCFSGKSASVNTLNLISDVSNVRNLHADRLSKCSCSSY